MRKKDFSKHVLKNNYLYIILISNNNMEILYYENPEGTLRINLHGSSDPLYSGRSVDSASIEIGKDVCNVFSFPIEYLQEIPLEKSETSQYLQELKRFNPLIFRDIKRIRLDEIGRAHV